MPSLGVRKGKPHPAEFHIRALMAALPRRTEWNMPRLKLFADMIGAKLASPGVYVDPYGWYYKLVE